MATVIGIVDASVLKARQNAAREERNARPLTHKPFAQAFRDLTVRKGKLVERKGKAR